jgi:hypothetical protein
LEDELPDDGFDDDNDVFCCLSLIPPPFSEDDDDDDDGGDTGGNGSTSRYVVLVRGRVSLATLSADVKSCFSAKPDASTQYRSSSSFSSEIFILEMSGRWSMPGMVVSAYQISSSNYKRWRGLKTVDWVLVYF